MNSGRKLGFTASPVGGSLPAPTTNRSKQVQIPKPITVIQNGQFLFIVHAYGERQARELVATRLADTTGVRIVKGSPR